MEPQSNEERTATPKAMLPTRSRQVIYYIVIPLLVVLALLLPPISLGDHILYAGYATLGERQWAVVATDEAELEVRPEDLTEPFRIKFLAVERNAFQAQTAGRELAALAKALPPQLVLRSPLYHFRLAGTPPASARFVAPLPSDYDSIKHLDLYGWQNGQWTWLPSDIQPESEQIVATLDGLPQALAVLEAQPVPPLIVATLRQGQQLPPEASDVLTFVNSRGLVVNEEGETDPLPLDITHGDIDILPSVSNWQMDGEAGVDINRLLADPAARVAHAQTLLQWAKDKPHVAVALEYRHIDPALRQEVTHFVRQVAEGLHAQDKRLILRVARPVRMPDGTWNTGAYDWAALGSVVDGITIPALLSPEAYQPDGEMDSLLSWATRQVERTKIQVVFNMDAIDQRGSRQRAVSYMEALRRLANLRPQEPPILEPGTSLTLELAAWQEAQGLEWDEATSTYGFSYTDEQGQTHTVHLENASSLSHKLRLVQAYGLAGVTVENLDGSGNDPQAWQVLHAFTQRETPQVTSRFTVWWTVRGPEGDQVAREPAPINIPRYVWQAPEEPGQYHIGAEIVADGQAVSGESEQPVWVATPIPTATPTPVSTPTPTSEPPTPTPIVSPTALPTPLPDAVVMSTVGSLNVRSGPATAFSRVGQLSGGDPVEVIGRTEEGDWLQIRYEEEECWVSAAYVQLNLSTEEIAVIADEDLPEKPAAVAQAPSVSSSAAAPAVVAVAPARSASFGYGVQAHFLSQDHGQVINAVRGMGFNWAKQQVRWEFHEPSRGQYSFGELDQMVNAANANGINILFSICASPRWATSGGNHYPANYQDFWNFMGALASHFKGRVRAYEVWNEQNLQREWGAPLSASNYVQLLSGAYQAIKSADPGAIVISGAPTPTGMNDGVIAINDRTYLEQMYQAGLARWCDAVGIHPSGFANPPASRWPEGNDPARGYDDHPSFFFRNTMEDYRNIMVRYGDGGTKLWPTEFGWPTVENLGVPPAPGYEFANDVNEARQASYLAQAYQMGRNWGWVGVMFLWNLNFGPVSGPADEKAAYGILRPDWSPRPAYVALRDMPK